MTIMYSLLSALFTIFLYFNPLSSTSPYETAEYFASQDRDADSYDSFEFFDTFGTELEVSAKRVVHYVERSTYWTDIYLGDDYFEGYSSMALEQEIKGELLHMNWDDPIEQVEGKVIVLPMTDTSLEKSHTAYTSDYYGVIDNDEAANRYLGKLAEAGAAGYVITPHPNEPDESGFVIVSYTLPIGGTGVDGEAAKAFRDGEMIVIEPYREEIPYIEYVQQGEGDEEIVIMSRLDASWKGDHVLSSVSGSSVLYHLLEKMDGVKTDATIRYVFLNGSGFGKEASDDYLAQLKERQPSVKTILQLDAMGTGDDPLYIRTIGMKRHSFLETEPFDALDVTILGSSSLDSYGEADLPLAVLSDSRLAVYDLHTEYDNLDRLSNEVMEEQVEWLKQWLITQ